MEPISTNDHEFIADTIRTRCGGFDDNYWSSHDEACEFPWDFYQMMAEDGWLGITIPEEYGGGGLGITEACVMMRAISASGAAMNGCSSIHLNLFGLEPVLKYGNERLKKTFLPRAADGQLHMAFAVTEPDAGSDTSKVSTRATLEGSSWRITGQKVWTTKALEAEVVLILVRTDAETTGRFGGLTLFLADLDRAYVDIQPIKKVGRNAVDTCICHYDSLPVEDWRRVGERGRGFYHLLPALNAERLLLSSAAIGIGDAALRHAAAYAIERRVFGRPIGANQAISHPLADSYARMSAAWEVVRLGAFKYDHGMECSMEANVSKFLAAEAGYMAADRAMQTLGGLGYATECHVERYWREARLLRIAPISQELVLDFIARKGLHLPRSANSSQGPGLRTL